MKIVVIAGGLNPERDVSLSSGSQIANALIEVGYKVCLVDLYMGIGTTNFDDMFDDLKLQKKYEYSVPPHEPDLDQLKEKVDNGNSLIGKNVIELCKMADLVFLALHGDIGENGKLQAIFDSYGITYTGTGYIGSLLAMDKDLSKLHMIQNQILTPRWKIINGDFEDIDKLMFQLKLPYVVKPCSCGSSVGITIVRSKDELCSAVSYAKRYEENIMIEEMIEGREFSVGILEGEALPVIEIIPHEGYFDYEAKYQVGLAQEICPAELPEETANKMKNIALQVHELLRLGSYSRIDFIIDNDENIFCLEANTLPGMTPTSLLPQEAEAAGISYSELCDRIARAALGSK